MSFSLSYPPSPQYRPTRPAPPRHSFIQHAGSAPPPAEGCEEMAGGREAKIPPVPSPAAERERRGGGRDRRGRLRVPPARGPQPGQAAGGRFLRRCRGGVLAVQGAAGAVPARRPLGPLPGRDPPQQQRRQVQYFYFLILMQMYFYFF